MHRVATQFFLVISLLMSISMSVAATQQDDGRQGFTEYSDGDGQSFRSRMLHGNADTLDVITNIFLVVPGEPTKGLACLTEDGYLSSRDEAIDSTVVDPSINHFDHNQIDIVGFSTEMNKIIQLRSTVEEDPSSDAQLKYIGFKSAMDEMSSMAKEVSQSSENISQIGDEKAVPDFFSRLIPLVLEYGFNSFLYSMGNEGRIDLKFGYMGHYIQTGTLSEVLYGGSVINATLAEQNATITSDTELDTAIICSGVLLSVCLAKGDFSIDKNHATHSKTFLMMLSKVPANMMTKVGNRFFSQLYSEYDKVYQTMYGQLTTSTTWAAGYLVVEVLRAGKYKDTYLLTIPAGHCLSCAFSNTGKTTYIGINSLLGKDQTGNNAVLAHLISAGLHAGVSIPVIIVLKKVSGKSVALIFVMTSAGHVFKGTSYALMNSIGQYLANLGFKDTVIDSLCLTCIGLVASLSSEYLVALDPNFRTGFSNTYAASLPFLLYFTLQWALY